MFQFIINDSRVPDYIQNFFCFIIIVGGLVAAACYLIWLQLCRGPGCKQYPNLPVWVQQLMDRDYFIIIIGGMYMLAWPYLLISLYLADVLYHFLCWIGLGILLE